VLHRHRCYAVTRNVAFEQIPVNFATDFQFRSGCKITAIQFRTQLLYCVVTSDWDKEEDAIEMQLAYVASVVGDTRHDWNGKSIAFTDTVIFIVENQRMWFSVLDILKCSAENTAYNVSVRHVT